MVTFHIAYTATINPASASPILSKSQVWAGLQRKIRHGEEFVPAITSCEVLSESGNEVVREVEFKPGLGPAGKVKEICTSFEPAWIDFVQTDGSVIKNVLADGPDGALFLTYVFQWLHPDMVAGEEAALAVEAKHVKVAKMAVESSIESIRRLVKEGKIE